MSDALPRAEQVAISDRVTIVLEKLADGKIRATSNSFIDAVVVGRREVLEIRSIGAGIRVAVKDRLADDKDRPVPAYDPYGPGANSNDI